MATVQPQTTQLEFHQAMADFKTMFPAMDDDVIEAVLRSNQGAVDVTIDQLLAMSTDNENEKIRNEFPEGTSLADFPQTSSFAEGNSGDDEIVSISTSVKNVHPSTPLKAHKRWAPPLLGPLPDDFLRFNLGEKSESELEDERIAMFLQNEEFLAELRWNKDFLSVLDKDSPSNGKVSKSQPSRNIDDDAAFRERLRNMGKTSRKKFTQLARKFTGCKKKGTVKTPSHKNPSPLLNEPDSDGA
ncbi:CUE domain-containing protein 1 [Bemisia tabaci]|nr:PREDICTED: CUE domain-containing protein 1 [Bemisia tabaci]